MEKKYTSGLKTTFLVHVIVGAIFGLIYLLIPEIFGNLINWPVKDIYFTRLVGAAILAFTVSSWFAYKAPTWNQVRITVQMEIVWTVLATLLMLWGLLAGMLPSIAWVNTILMAGFAVAFSYFYFRK
jgi:hypothetical protein